LPGSDIASVAKHKLIGQQQSYVQLYSKGKLELISTALIIALSMTYAKVTSVDRFWDILREYFRNIEPNQLVLKLLAFRERYFKPSTDKNLLVDFKH
jgi:hypothetical protein